MFTDKHNKRYSQLPVEIKAMPLHMNEKQALEVLRILATGNNYRPCLATALTKIAVKVLSA